MAIMEETVPSWQQPGTVDAPAGPAVRLGEALVGGSALMVGLVAWAALALAHLERFSLPAVSALSAAAAALAALPLGVLVVRHPGRLSALVERSTYAGYALPAIVIALALVFFGANYATPLYQTLWLLVFAYVVRFLPQAVGATRTAVLQVNPSLEEAARGLGRGPLHVLATVTFPLIRPGILAGAALVFLTSMKELPATLLLAPTGYKTLATAIWGWAAEARYAQAAAPALLLILVSGLSLLLLLRDRRLSVDA